MDISKTSIKTKEKRKKGSVANSTSILQHPIFLTMSRQVDTHIQMANYFSRIEDLINRPEVDRRGLRDLLWQIQWEPQNIHPITKDICEQVIYYITEVADDDESEAYNENMDFLSETLDEVPKVILSDSTHKKVDLLNLYMDTERRTEQEPQHNDLINIVRKIIQAAINLLFKTIRARTQLPEASQNEGEDQAVPILRAQTEEEKNHLH